MSWQIIDKRFYEVKWDFIIAADNTIMIFK